MKCYNYWLQVFLFPISEKNNYTFVLTVRMKKFIVAILAFLYISTSSGATVHMHYCMGKLVNWSLGHSESDKCDKCGMEKNATKSNGCCKDEHKQMKVEKDQKGVESFQMLQLLPCALPVSFIEVPAHDFSSVTEGNPFSHAPPRSSTVAVYIRNCFFRI